MSNLECHGFCDTDVTLKHVDKHKVKLGCYVSEKNPHYYIELYKEDIIQIAKAMNIKPEDLKE